MRLMVDGGFQERSEATEKWSRARLSSDAAVRVLPRQRGDARARAEERRRADGEGREFAYRPFLESVINHGTPSLPVIREILFGSS